MHGFYTRLYMRLDAKHVSPRLRGASGDVRRCRGERHDRKITVEFETMIEWSNMSGSATRSRLPLGAYDHALGHKQQLPQCLICTMHRGTRRPRGHALRRTSELLRTCTLTDFHETKWNPTISRMARAVEPTPTSDGRRNRPNSYPLKSLTGGSYSCTVYACR